MYNEDSDDGSGSDCSDFLSVPVKKKRNKTKELTWAEAAEIILKRFDHPLPPKEVLRLMQEDDLKTGITASSPVAVLNAVLNNQSKGVNPLFYKCPSGASSYGLVRTRKRPGTTMTKAPPYTPPKQNQITREVKELPKREARVTKKLNPPTAQISRSLNPPGKAFPAPSGLRVKKPLIPPGEKTPVTNITNRYTPPLGSLSKAAYLERLKQQPQHRRMMGPTTSALVRPSPPFSRPPPGAALRVMPPKKRVKIDKDENDSDSSTQSKNDDEPIRKRPLVTKIKINNDARKGMPRNIPPRSAIKQQLKQPRSITPEFKNKINHRSISRTANNKVSSLQRKLAPPTINTNKHLSQMKKSSSQSSLHSPVTNRRLANASSSLSRLKTASPSSETRDHNKFFVGSKFRKFRKGGYVPKQETKIDLMSPDSILSTVQLKDLFNASTFRLLPPAYQYQLLMLLPECDRISNKDGSLRLSSACFNNGFFSRACQEYKDKLMDGDLNSEITTRAKQEIKTYTRLDPWKVKYFEPVYGQSSVKEDIPEDERPHDNIKPIQSSWVPFLKFAENSTGEYERSLSKIQAQVKETREREAREKEEADRQRKEELSQRSNLLSSPTSSSSSATPNKLNKTPFRCAPLRHQSSLTRSPLARSPMTTRPPTSRISSVESSKEKSKRALKRAQLLQRKKIFDKQLKDAKARILEDARSNSAIKENRKQFLTRSVSSSSETEKNLTTVTSSSPSKILPTAIKKDKHLTKLCIVSSSSTTSLSTSSPSSININTTNSSLTTTTTINPLLQKFIHDSETAVAESSSQYVAQSSTTTETTSAELMSNTTSATLALATPNNTLTTTSTTTCNHKKTDTTIIKTASNSKIIQGAANFGTNSNGSCPCNVKAMFLCKRCGSAWHGDCINSDKICISCS